MGGVQPQQGAVAHKDSTRGEVDVLVRGFDWVGRRRANAELEKGCFEGIFAEGTPDFLARSTEQSPSE